MSEITFMTHDEKGRWKQAETGCFAVTIIRQVFDFWANPGYKTLYSWTTIRRILCDVCLGIARDNLANPGVADTWIKRYQQIREIQ